MSEYLSSFYFECPYYQMFTVFCILSGSTDLRLTQPPSVFQLPPLHRNVSFLYT